MLETLLTICLAGVAFCLGLLSKQTGKAPKESPALPVQAEKERMKVEWDNLMSYNGTERGQKGLEE